MSFLSRNSQFLYLCKRRFADKELIGDSFYRVTPLLRFRNYNQSTHKRVNRWLNNLIKEMLIFNNLWGFPWAQKGQFIWSTHDHTVLKVFLKVTFKLKIKKRKIQLYLEAKNSVNSRRHTVVSYGVAPTLFHEK